MVGLRPILLLTGIPARAKRKEHSEDLAHQRGLIPHKLFLESR